jgi:hypothetical protein
VTAAEFAKRVKGAKRRADGPWWDGRCPAHPDDHGSLSWRDGDRGLIVKCHAGCGREAIAQAVGLPLAQLSHAGNGNGSQPRPIATTYDYTDAAGGLRYQVVRYDPKDFRQRRPNGRGGCVWNMDGISRVPYRLPELAGAARVYITEGEKDADTLRSLGLMASCNEGGAGKWRPEHSQALVKADPGEVVVLRDNDRPGAAHQFQVASSLVAAGLRVKILEHLPGLPPLSEKHGQDVSDWLAAGHTMAELEGLADAAPLFVQDAAGAAHELREPAGGGGIWASAIALPAFLGQEDEVATFLEPRLLVRGVITEVFAPRGLGKTQVAYAIGLRLERAGHRVLLVDRDNPRDEIRRRMRGWGGADAEHFRVLTRDKAPALTDTAAWGLFPLETYDVVIIDSLDAAAEGVGEGDSAKPSVAFAAVLDLARRTDGPAILVLGNVVKSGAHSRGSGVIEDRADIVYEVRDATDLKPSGQKDWWHELAAAGVGDWAQRASRRKRRDSYRLAFIPTKFRVGEEPEPFAFEIDHRSTPWSLRDVTNDLVEAGHHALAAAISERESHEARAQRQLLAQMRHRADCHRDPLIKTEAEALLQAEGLTRAAARKVLDEGAGKLWQFVPGSARGEKGGTAVYVQLSSDPLCEASAAARTATSESPRETALRRPRFTPTA